MAFMGYMGYMGYMGVHGGTWGQASRVFEELMFWWLFSYTGLNEELFIGWGMTLSVCDGNDNDDDDDWRLAVAG